MVLFQRTKAPVNVDISYGGDEFENVHQHGQNKNNYGNHYSSSSPWQSSRSSINTSRKQPKSSRSFSILQLAFLGLMCVQCIRSHKNVQRINMELAELQIEYESTHSNLVDLEHELDSAHIDFHQLQMKLLASQSNNVPPLGIGEEARKEVTDRIIEKQEHQVDRIAQLQKSIQKNYEVELERRFGPGPYLVEFNVNINGKKKFLTVETAPNSLMPHSVFYFMEMIERKVWDQTVFVHNAEHIISAVLTGHDGKDKSHLVEERLAFQEYSHEFVHDEYTLGFAGTGPGFYFNIRDNADVHGPGGQGGSTAILDDADPCFAKVIIGGETMELLKKVSLDAATKSSDNVNISYIEKAVIIKLPAERVKKLKNMKS